MNQTNRRWSWAGLCLLAGYGTPLASAAMVLALGLGFWEQWRLDRRLALPWTWAMLGASALAFALLTYRDALERVRRQPLGVLRPRLLLLVPVLALWVWAFPGFSGNRFRPLPTLAWLAGLALLYVAFAADRPAAAVDRRRSRAGPGPGLVVPWHLVALLGIAAVGAFLRLSQLDAIPREMGVDMPLKYENAREIMNGQFMIFCPRYPGREALYFYLIAAYGKLFGLGFFAIKFTSAWLGLVTIPVLYGVASHLFDRQVALVAAAFLAVSKWHVILSRTGYRAVMVPLTVLILIFLLVRALESGRGRDFVLAGICLGLGLYTYNAFLIVPPAMVAVVTVELLRAGRRSFARYGWGVLGLGLAAVGVYLPLARYALESPQSYLFRVASRVTDVETPLPRDLVRTFANNLWRTAGMFNLQGDSMFYINVPYQRELGVITGVLFLFGLAYALLHWRRGYNAMLLIFLGALVLPTALAISFPQEVPNAIRAAGVMAPVYLLAGIPLVLLYRRVAALLANGIQLPLAISLGWGSDWRRRWQGRIALNSAVLAGVVLVVLVGLEYRETWRAYFRDYVRILPGRNYAISLELARALDDFASEGPAYIKDWPYWYDGNAVRAQLKVTPRDWDWHLSELDPAKPPLSTAQGQVLVIVHPQDLQALAALRRAFPKGVAINHRDNAGRVAFITFYGER